MVIGKAKDNEELTVSCPTCLSEFWNIWHSKANEIFTCAPSMSLSILLTFWMYIFRFWMLRIGMWQAPDLSDCVDSHDWSLLAQRPRVCEHVDPPVATRWEWSEFGKPAHQTFSWILFMFRVLPLLHHLALSASQWSCWSIVYSIGYCWLTWEVTLESPVTLSASRQPEHAFDAWVQTGACWLIAISDIVYANRLLTHMASGFRDCSLTMNGDMRDRILCPSCSQTDTWLLMGSNLKCLLNTAVYKSTLTHDPHT